MVRDVVSASRVVACGKSTLRFAPDAQSPNCSQSRSLQVLERLAPQAGFEPATLRLRARGRRCSACRLSWLGLDDAVLRQRELQAASPGTRSVRMCVSCRTGRHSTAGCRHGQAEPTLQSRRSGVELPLGSGNDLFSMQWLFSSDSPALDVEARAGWNLPGRDISRRSGGTGRSRVDAASDG